jgi:hypothetical protein
MNNDWQYGFSRLYLLILWSFFVLSSSVSSAQTPEPIGQEQDVKLVWSASNYGHGEQIYYSSYKKNSWDNPVQLSDSTDMVFQPACSFGFDGKVWVVWSRQDKKGSFLQFSVSSDSRWMEPVTIDTGMSNNKAATIIVDRDNVAWIAWTAIDDQYPDVFWSKWKGKRWEIPVRAHDLNSVPDVQPALSLNEAGNVILSWQTFAGGKYVTLSQGWNGKQWQAVSHQPGEEIRQKLLQGEKGRVPVPTFVEDPRKATLFIKGKNEAGSFPLSFL